MFPVKNVFFHRREVTAIQFRSKVGAKKVGGVERRGGAFPGENPPTPKGYTNRSSSAICFYEITGFQREHGAAPAARRRAF
jgi:hypothetical protein